MNFIKKAKQMIIKNKYYLLSFFIPLLITCLVFIYFDIFLVNENMAPVSDMYGQYLSFFVYLKDIFNGTQNIFYSFEKGLGGNMIGTIAYYLSSPLNIITIFFSKINIHHMLFILIVTKISLSGFTMYLFLNKHFKFFEGIQLLIFSTSYSLMAYNVVYYFHIMWLDGVILAPLVMMGIDKILDNKGSKIYILTLFLSILTNFYIGFMICIFSVFYFLYNYFLQRKKNIKNIIDFSISSLLGGMLTAFMLLPVLKELSATSKMEKNIFITNPLDLNLNIFDIFSKFIVGAQKYENILNNNSVLIYTGMFTLVLIILYFFNNKISNREKFLTSGVILTFVLSVLINHLNYIWHGFNEPLSFNYRFSFLYSLFFILISLRSFIKLKEMDPKKYIIVGIIVSVLLLPVAIFNYIYLFKYLILISLFISYMYLFLLYLFSSKIYFGMKKQILLLIFTLVLAELTFNFYFSLKDYAFKNAKEYSDFYSIFSEKINSIIHSDNDKFYRIEKTKTFTLNDGLLIGYNGINSFLSTSNSRVVNFFSNNGYTAPENTIFYDNINPIVDSILGVKYVIHSDDFEMFYKKIDNFSFSKYGDILYGVDNINYNISKNENALSLGFMVNEDIKRFVDLFVKNGNYDKLALSDFILQNMIGDYSQNIMEKIKVQKIDQYNYKLTIDKNEPIFGYVHISFGNINDEASTYLNDVLIYKTNYMNNGFFTLHNNPFSEIQTDYNLKVDVKGTAEILIQPTFYYFNKELYEKRIKELSTNQMEILDNSGNYIKAKINSTSERPILFTSIPFDKGWSAYVDGKKVNVMEAYGTFISLELPPGKHIIEFKFRTPGLIEGIVLSGIFFIALITYLFKRKYILEKTAKLYLKFEELIAYVIAGALTTFVSIGSYALFTRTLNINFITSSIISWILAVIFAYFVNKIFVFHSKSVKIINELFHFIKYRILSLLMDVGIMFILVSIIGLNDIISKIFVQIIVLISNYIFSKIFVFKNTH